MANPKIRRRRIQLFPGCGSCHVGLEIVLPIRSRIFDDDDVSVGLAPEQDDGQADEQDDEGAAGAQGRVQHDGGDAFCVVGCRRRILIRLS